MSNSDKSRRWFLKKAGLISAGMTIIPSKVMSGLGYKAPGDKLNIAGVGIGGKDILICMGWQLKTLLHCVM